MAGFWEGGIGCVVVVGVGVEGEAEAGEFGFGVGEVLGLGGVPVVGCHFLVAALVASRLEARRDETIAVYCPAL